MRGRGGAGFPTGIKWSFMKRPFDGRLVALTFEVKRMSRKANYYFIFVYVISISFLFIVMLHYLLIHKP